MRRLVALVAAVMAMAVGGVSFAADDLAALTNADRAGHGLPALGSVSELATFAQRRAEEMARDGRLWHTQDLGAEIGDWRSLGENVGRGPTVSEIESGFMASDVHRRNILGPDWTDMGVGVAWDGTERFYVAVIFRQPRTAPAPAPAPPPPPAPRVASSPPPAPGPVPPPAASQASPPATAPPAPAPPPEPAPPRPAAPPAPVPREAGPHLERALAATTWATAPAASPVPAASGTAVSEPAAAGRDVGPATGRDSMPLLPVGAAVAGLIGAWAGVLTRARRPGGPDRP